MEKDICCYVLFSEKLGKFYIGACQDNLQERVLKLNTGFYSGKKYTKAATDWKLFLRVEAKDYSHALRIERKIKSMKSSVYIKNIEKYSDLLHRIQEETRQST